MDMFLLKYSLRRGPLPTLITFPLGGLASSSR
jgi:hypothetical protein